MRKLHFGLITILFSFGTLSAQHWLLNGNDIYNTNTNNVGIGTNNPVSKFSVYQGAGTASYPTTSDKGDVLETLESANNILEFGVSKAYNARKSWILIRHSSNAYGQSYGSLHLQPDVGDKSQFRGVGIGYPADIHIPLSTHLAVNGKVGIGTMIPGFLLDITTDQNNTSISTSNNYPLAITNKSNVINSIAGMQFKSKEGFQSAAATIGVQFTDPTNDEGDLFFLTNGTTGYGRRMTITGNGDLGIGTTNPSYKLQVNGSAGKPGSNLWTIASDLRLKQGVEPFMDGLEVLQKINPVWYRYNGKAGTPTDEKYVGIIAQDMQKVAPYTIGTFDYKDERGDSAKYLNYDGNAVTYITINAIKEQQQLIEALQERIEVLENLLTNVNGIKPLENASLQNKSISMDSKKYILYQNTPNPFDKITIISAKIPETVRQAKITIYNLNGLELESYDLNKRGNISVEISGGVLPSGQE